MRNLYLIFAILVLAVRSAFSDDEKPSLLVTRIEPERGYTTGDTIITVFGENFDENLDDDAQEEGDGDDEDVAAYCIFDGSEMVEADDIDIQFIICKTPPHAVGDVTVEVQIGKTVSSSGVKFQFVAAITPVFRDFRPKRPLVLEGGDELWVSGDNFQDWHNDAFRARLACKDAFVPLEVEDVGDEIYLVTPPSPHPFAEVFLEMSFDSGATWTRVGGPLTYATMP